VVSKEIVTAVPTPTISVVLATKGNKCDLLEKCLKSLQHQTFRDFEIILVYKFFPKPLEELFQTLNVVTMKENGSTLGAARNLGAKNARGQLVSFIDDDAEAPEDWLEKIASAFKQQSQLCCLGGPHFTPKEEQQANSLRFVEGALLEDQLQKTHLNESAIGKIAGCNVTYSKRVFEKVGFINETMRSGEDWEFHERLVEKGCEMKFDPAIFVYHHRQGLKHAFKNSSNMVPFFFSWRTLKFSRFEPSFFQFYFMNVFFVVLIVLLFISPYVFIFLVFLSLAGYFLFTAVRTRGTGWKITYYPMAVSLAIARVTGFYYGILRYVFLDWYRR
jgi:GT2 family glycosyltransferase